MPTYEQGETDTFEGADQYLIQVNSGEIALADSKQGATMTGITFGPEDGLIPFITSPPHERMVIKAVTAADVDIQINEGFKLDLFGFNLFRVDVPNQTGISTESERSTRLGDVVSEFDNLTPADGENAVANMFTDDQEYAIEVASAALFQQAYTDDISIEIVKSEPLNPAIARFAIGNPTNLPFAFDPAFRVGSEQNVDVLVENASGATVDVRVVVVAREIN